MYIYPVIQYEDVYIQYEEGDVQEEVWEVAEKSTIFISMNVCPVWRRGCSGMCERKYREVAEKSTIFIRAALLCGAAIQCPPQVMADASFPLGLVASRRYHSHKGGGEPSLNKRHDAELFLNKHIFIFLPTTDTVFLLVIGPRQHSSLRQTQYSILLYRRPKEYSFLWIT